MLVYRYSDVQLKLTEAAFVIFLFGGLYAVNYGVRFMPPSTLINLTIVLSPLLLGCAGRALELVASGEGFMVQPPGRAGDANISAGPSRYREIYTEALTHISSGSGRRRLKALLREAGSGIPFGREELPLISRIAGWLAWLGMHRQARSLCLEILRLDPRHFLAAALCFRYALEAGSRGTVRKYGTLLVNADFASHFRKIENERDTNLLRFMDSREEMVLTYTQAADLLSGMGAFHDAARARQIAAELRSK
jgi:hypothetical protein